MFICLCKGITDTQIQEAVKNGANNLQAVRRELGVATQCCKCLPEARALIDQSLNQLADSEITPHLYYSA